MIVLRVESGLFFANSDWVRAQVRAAAAQPGTTVVVLDASNIAFIDVTAVEVLDELVDTLHGEGVTLRIARDIGGVRDVIGEAAPQTELRRVFPSVQEAIDAGPTAPATA